ncbi:cysteinyl-tRNA synthetase [Nitrobacter hamburgensis X14]|uniref:Cysteine--tRNA ligase n=1 Tax=Nitrobacter hamburgensis (strain DSM 10229 / NCIMB 13809 / X14) TaxID=323097 RepID=SYC_NITHX|nr:cysteine--tRNA ligase [Nitrobacter hamburgensis]Q1QN87.1 RecName: Full=Cysteine--tRNA ligase; AltName: Full=Cysteinyl-tRNA synthetase; Short=CysRS [Nitrobacter hamburgensis X14]ABE62310.1 cysteinyl-tRNA synthetase [Nitrobacter hamburgensis X14]
MELRLYDTLTKEKRAFIPIDPSNVRMYVCGPTVYDFAHIGNARPVIVFDVLFRLLQHIYGTDHVTYVRNITDVDDKINDRAARDFPGLPLNEAIRKVTEKTAEQFQADVAALGCLPPTHQPRATEFVLPRDDGRADMVTLIKQLIARGHAYEAGGEVLFDVQSMPDYGALSGRRLEEQKAGARVAVDAHKRNPADFVLWKLSSENEPGWDSPWGRGRPGWHIECSAMSAAYLGDVFDIHGGGLDLIFPHHENEIAQSRCAHGTHTMANYWMHNGFLQVEGEKMSKSLGNFFTINELLTTEKFGGRKWPGEVLRLAMLKTHYRSPIDWTVDALEESKRILDSWYDIVGDDTEAIGEVDREVSAFLGDDLNTSAAVTRLHAIAASRIGKSGQLQIDAKRKLKVSAVMLGLLGRTKREYLETDPQVILVDSNLVAHLLSDRAAARARKDFKESDRIRDELAAMGVVLKDGKDADGKPETTWEIAR